jgi:hypothetical protein
MKNNERVAHWLEAARIAADALEHCIAEAQRALREEAAPEEVAETPTAPLRPHLAHGCDKLSHSGPG